MFQIISNREQFYNEGPSYRLDSIDFGGIYLQWTIREG